MLITKATIFFFDMDGTLINTNVANFLSYKAAILNVVGMDSSLPPYDTGERFNRSWLKSLFPSLGESVYKEIICEKEKCYKDYLCETTLIKENVGVLLKYSATHRMVLVSNSRRRRVMETLSYYGLVNKFTDIFYRETIQGMQIINKYQNAINILGVSPDDIIAFENEDSEIAAAIEAEIKIINPKTLL